MGTYLVEAQLLASLFSAITISQIPRGQNSWANALAKLAFVFNEKIKQTIPIQYLNKLAILGNKGEAMFIDTSSNWMTHIYDYLAHGMSPPNINASSRVQNRANR